MRRQGKAKKIACNVSQRHCAARIILYHCKSQVRCLYKARRQKGGAAKRYGVSRELRNVIRVRDSIRGTGMVMQTNKERQHGMSKKTRKQATPLTNKK